MNPFLSAIRNPHCIFAFTVVLCIDIMAYVPKESWAENYLRMPVYALTVYLVFVLHEFLKPLKTRLKSDTEALKAKYEAKKREQDLISNLIAERQDLFRKFDKLEEAVDNIHVSKSMDEKEKFKRIQAIRLEMQLTLNTIKKFNREIAKY